MLIFLKLSYIWCMKTLVHLKKVIRCSNRMSFHVCVLLPNKVSVSSHYCIIKFLVMNQQLVLLQAWVLNNILVDFFMNYVTSIQVYPLGASSLPSPMKCLNLKCFIHYMVWSCTMEYPSIQKFWYLLLLLMFLCYCYNFNLIFLC